MKICCTVSHSRDVGMLNSNWHVWNQNNGLVVVLFCWQCNYMLLYSESCTLCLLLLMPPTRATVVKGYIYPSSIDTKCFFFLNPHYKYVAWLFPTRNFTVEHIIGFLWMDWWCHRNCKSLLAGFVKSATAKQIKEELTGLGDNYWTWRRVKVYIVLWFQRELCKFWSLRIKIIKWKRLWSYKEKSFPSVTCSLSWFGVE